MLYGIICCYILLYGVYMVLYSIIYSVVIHFSHFRPFLHYPYPIYIYIYMGGVPLQSVFFLQSVGSDLDHWMSVFDGWDRFGGILVIYVS